MEKKETANKNELNNEDPALNLGNNGNYIVGEINIKENDINKDIRIINSYEEYHRNYDFKEFRPYNRNEEEIKKCEIRINDELIPFTYFYRFSKKGKYKIKYSFENILTIANSLFYKCEFLTNLDFTNFNSSKITDMEAMFCECISLTNLNLSNFNTENVTNMNHLFYKCESLIKLDLSNFNTQNVTIMYCMFEGCKSLTSLDLTNFNTQSIKSIFDMDDMLDGCDSLKGENIITNDEKMLYCISHFMPL